MEMVVRGNYTLGKEDGETHIPITKERDDLERGQGGYLLVGCERCERIVAATALL